MQDGGQALISAHARARHHRVSQEEDFICQKLSVGSLTALKVVLVLGWSGQRKAAWSESMNWALHQPFCALTCTSYAAARLGHADPQEAWTLKHASGASATVYAHGATLTSVTTASGTELLFVSDASKFDGVNPIRGGVPVVFPIFGDGWGGVSGRLRSHSSLTRSTVAVVSVSFTDDLACKGGLGARTSLAVFALDD